MGKRRKQKKTISLKRGKREKQKFKEGGRNKKEVKRDKRGKVQEKKREKIRIKFQVWGEKSTNGQNIYPGTLGNESSTS